ncbi:unnamed protein product [Lactuca virosa]|uniref:Uncharacterized protein n=1 Tax=Lactuca virosa TaxID=75947 RepID=A0AAU9PB63_9ASTR|nr:unnamed protein product [Lactuca virosa]
MLQVEEQRIQLNDQRNQSHIHSDNSSSPSALVTGPDPQSNLTRGNNHGSRGGRGGKGFRGGRIGNRGGCNGGNSGFNHFSRQQQPPAGWGFGWYPLAGSVGSSTTQQQADLLPIPPTQQSPTHLNSWPNNSQQSRQFGLAQFPQQVFTTSTAQPTPPWSWFGPPSQQQSQPTTLPELFNTMSLNDPTNHS